LTGEKRWNICWHIMWWSIKPRFNFLRLVSTKFTSRIDSGRWLNSGFMFTSHAEDVHLRVGSLATPISRGPNESWRHGWWRVNVCWSVPIHVYVVTNRSSKSEGSQSFSLLVINNSSLCLPLFRWVRRDWFGLSDPCG
jgi:hypothetical protein